MCNSEQKLLPFYLLVRLIFAHVVCIYDQCIYCSNVDHAIKTLPLSICELLAVLCALHKSDPVCLLQGILIFLSNPFYTVTLCVRVKIQKLLHKSTIQWQYEVHLIMFAASISEPCQWSWRDNHEFFWLVCVSIMFKNRTSEHYSRLQKYRINYIVTSSSHSR